MPNSINQVVHVVDDVLETNVLPPVSGALFISKVCDFLATLDGGILRSNKMIDCLLDEKVNRDKCTKDNAP